MLHTSLPTHRPRREVPPLLLTTVLAVAVALVGCASGPKPGGVPRNAPSADRDGADANPPKDLALVPDAEPRVEGIRSSGPNRPYEVLGRRYVPITQDRPFSERGLASWYGRKFHGRPTASGETYDMYGMTAAHPTMPLPSYARVRNPANGREVIVRVNDRGPFHPGRIIDLSYTAALKLGLLRGVAVVEVERLTHDSIRARNGRGETVAEALSPQADEAMPSPAPVVTGSAPLLPLESDAVASGSAGSESKGNDKPERAADKAGDGIEKADLPALPDVAQGNAFWVQLGAFRQRDGAETFQRRVAAELDWPLERLAVFNDAALFRLQAGPYASRGEARSAAERIRSALQLVPVVLERR
jgi:rare lipoprotein A